MKEKVICFIVALMIVSMVAAFSLGGCKTQTGTETTAATTAEATTAAEATVAVETTAVVAGEQELYVFAGGWWGTGVWKQIKYGGQQAEKFWNDRGDNIKVEFAGPMEADMNAIYAGLETAIAKNPTGIVYGAGLGLNEGPIVEPYLKNGGMIFTFNDWYSTQWDATGNVGTPNDLVATAMAKKAIEMFGEKFTVGIATISGDPVHKLRRDTVEAIFSKYPDIKIVGYFEQGKTTEEGTANATAFLAANPDVDGFLTMSSETGPALVTALKEANIAAGDKWVIASDVTDPILAAIKEGYISATFGSQFASVGFYCVTNMHLMHLDPCPLTTDDKATGFVPGLVDAKLLPPSVDAKNIDLWTSMNQAAD